jgi:hypothetical protein
MDALKPVTNEELCQVEGGAVPSAWQLLMYIVRTGGKAPWV